MSTQKNGNTAVAEKPDRAKLALVGKQIDEIRRGYEQSYAEAGNDYERSCILACGLIDLRQAVKAYLPVLRQLQGSKLGFRTDKDRDGGYGEQVMTECAIEAVMRGARWTGNEFNIIAGGCYLTKEFWGRKVGEIEGLTDLDLNPGIPEYVNQKCVVRFAATWKLNGRTMTLNRVIPILVRNSQTDDATLGKAEARMLKAVYKRVTGSDIGDAGDDEPVVTVERPAQATAPAAIAPPKQLAEGEIEDDGEPFDWSAGKDATEREQIESIK